MQFKVPQFLDIEDKIFGPFTFSEFAYLIGGAGLCFILYKIFGLLIALIPMLIIVALSLALVFYKPNSKPFVNMLESAFIYAVQDKLYIWKKKPKKKVVEKQPIKADVEGIVHEKGRKLSGSKLRDLSWSLDVLDLKKEDHQI